MGEESFIKNLKNNDFGYSVFEWKNMKCKDSIFKMDKGCYVLLTSMHRGLKNEHCFVLDTASGVLYDGGETSIDLRLYNQSVL